MKAWQWVGMTALLSLVALAGCQNSEAPPAKPAANMSVKAPAGLAKLTPEDLPIAEAQRLCPVSGEALGEMGTPVKVDIKGQTVFLCCDACKEKALGNPDKTLAKVEKYKLAGR